MITRTLFVLSKLLALLVPVRQFLTPTSAALSHTRTVLAPSSAARPTLDVRHVRTAPDDRSRQPEAPAAPDQLIISFRPALGPQQYRTARQRRRRQCRCQSAASTTLVLEASATRGTSWSIVHTVDQMPPCSV